MQMKAMIFSAGLGKRLGKITENIPKALIDINGKTALHRAVEKCTLHGFSEIIINVHHFAGMVENEAERLRQLGYTLSVSDERKMLLETGGGLFKARYFFDQNPFLLYNTDIITDLDLTALLGFHKKNRGLATLAVRNRPGNRLFLVDGEGILHGWYNKTTGEQIISGRLTEGLTEIAFSGIHIVNPEIFSYMEEGIFSLTTLYLQLASDHKIFTFRHDGGYWYDMGTPESLEKVRSFLKSG
jgi:MurNAc alpha-1-phosphate uridylyltransferase